MVNTTIVSAIKCGSYDVPKLVEKITETINLAGGFPKNIKPGAKILLKPNLLTPKRPEAVATTHPEFVRAVIRILKINGISDITIGDSSAGNHSWEYLWKETGMQKVANEENVKIIPFVNSKFIKVDSQNVPILKELDEFDAVISLPKLKIHTLTKITAAIKNSYGLVIGNAKSHLHSKYPSPRKISRFLAKLFGFLKPDFIILDAIDCMEKDGPSSGHLKHIGLIFCGTDAVAIDSCVCGIYEYKAAEIEMITAASKANLGISDDKLITKVGDGWNMINSYKAKHSLVADILYVIPEKLFFVVTYLVRCRPVINQKICKKCSLCAGTCSRKAISIDKNSRYKIQKSKCILCLCCIEACPYNSISLKASLLWRCILKFLSICKRIHRYASGN